MLENDYSFIERYAPMSLDLLPDNQKSIIEKRLNEISNPMSKKDIERLLTIDLSQS